VPALDVHLLVDYRALLLDLVQPVVNPNIDAISPCRDPIRQARLEYHCQP